MPEKYRVVITTYETGQLKLETNCPDPLQVLDTLNAAQRSVIAAMHKQAQQEPTRIIQPRVGIVGGN